MTAAVSVSTWTVHKLGRGAWIPTSGAGSGRDFERFSAEKTVSEWFPSAGCEQMRP